MKPRIALFQHHPECSRQCVTGMIEALGSDYHIKICSNEFYTKENLREVDMVAFPGGIGDADTFYTFFKRRHGNAIEDFIESGGRYLGICMGAYWAGSHYFDILKGVEPVQYITRETADIKRPYGTVAQVEWLGKYQEMFFYDGCCFDHRGGDYKVFANYTNGDPMAIIQGRVGLIGCHPESEQFWFDKYKYISKYWHDKKHHQLLLDFTNRLFNEERGQDGNAAVC